MVAGLVAAALAGLTWAAAPRAPKADNPHWKADGCANCHAGGAPRPISAEAADEICLKCHDGRSASAEFHPVGRKFDGTLYTRPQRWPLADGRLGCLTCHDMLPACSAQAKRSTSNRMLLRDYQVGRSQSLPFCRNCHQESAYRKLNPHTMLLADRDETIEDKCLFCHERPLDRTARQRSGKPALKTDELSLCRDCHPQHKDPMPQGHIGLKVDAEMRAIMAVRETMGLSAKLTPQLLAQAKGQGGSPTLMPTRADGTIVCTTCHNPHLRGVFPPDSVLGFRAMRIVDEGKMISPVRGQAWCKHCHEF